MRRTTTHRSVPRAGGDDQVGGSQQFSRRSVLGLAGLAAVAGLAACSSPRSGESTTVATPAGPSNSPAVSSFDLAGGSNGRAPTVALNSGHAMPVAGIGTLQLDQQQAYDSVTAALAAGVRLIDTAYAYRNEAQVAQAVRDSAVPREDVFLSTKLFPTQFATAGAAIDGALERMGVDYLDMMLLHRTGPFDTTAYHAMERAMEEGKLRSIGVSNWYREDWEPFLANVSIPPAIVQNENHPTYQDPSLVPYVHDLGIAYESWYPLGGRGHVAQMLADPTITELAQSLGRSPAQTILRWNLQRGVIVIPGSGDPDHIVENISVFDFELSAEQMETMNALNRDEKFGIF
ncbi:aldo/keto reductase [Isoptericola haloaureus]|uniref:Aldo/keto reductase n=1 Tax=Isoptericola haloaureus TaxID=1542902 RepID=A0ABU7Z351_9MICO